ncbi:uncharacterized protein K489DRAFT_379932 [Dissoconium aciculare CBS 342.82]|uniref:Uncharacterized protein n=1 Tax=Dissoconium aciculare CBS 342.82 TaxID=1314786 RepID=A0A6J3M4Y5_9PEZI|nr:uncharacterized protein K489DRAFT_379932 [Dissoconium aciculare CBS 342.82]KAF1822564.1 hypothetical protein K489DRAFT_379932 [Dissoconium aciculare CBS 342.82]
MSANSQSAYGQESISRPAHSTSGENEDPVAAMSSYQRIMHEHTRQQFETATASSRRRSVQSSSDVSSPSERKASLQSQSSVSSSSS